MNVAQDFNNQVDFTRIISNNATFIANIYDKNELERIKTKPKAKKKGKVTDDPGFSFFGDGDS